MKNLIKVLKSSFLIRIAFITTVFITVVASGSCKHDKGKDGLKGEVKLTFIPGNKVTILEPTTVKVTKGSSLKLSDIKAKITKMEFEAEWDFGKLCVGAEDGIEITDAKPFVATYDADIYVVARKKGNIFLTSLKVDSNRVAIQDDMKARSAIDDEVSIEFMSNPSDATLSFEPALKTYDDATKKGTWALEMGENSLTITLTHGLDTKEYTLKIEKVEDEAEGLIKSITIGAHTKRRTGIVLEDTGTIEIPLPTELKTDSEYDIKVVPKEEGATIEYYADDADLKTALESGKFKFKKPSSILDLESEFSIKVSKGSKESNYKVKAIMMTNAAAFLGARLNGKNTSADLETVKKILRGEDITLNIAGHEAFLIFASQISKWETVLCNDEDIKIPLSPNDPKYTSMGSASISFDALGATTDIKVIISNSEWDETEKKFISPWLATEEFNFKIKCNETPADAFIKEVLVNGASITDEKKIPESFTALFGTELVEIDSGKSATIAVRLSKKVQKVKINDIEINEDQIKIEKDNKGKIIGFIAEAKNIAVEGADGKEVTIVVSPKAEDTYYRETTMKFKLVYEMPPQFYPAYFNINETDWKSIPQGFKEAIMEDRCPLYTIKTNSLGMKFVFAKKPKKVEMIIGGVKTESSKIQEIKPTYGPVRYMVQVLGTASDVEQEVILGFEPEDEGTFSKGEWKFKIKGTNDKPKIAPKFLSISKDENLSWSFLNNLTSGNEEYCASEESAELLISLSLYEVDFLLKEIEVNGVKATDKEFKLFKGYTFTEWRLTKIIEGLTSEGKDVIIKFIGADGIADDVEWKFKLKSGGEKPKVPRYQIRFGLAGYGLGATPFTNDFLIGLEDNTEPMIELYGKDVTVSFASFKKEYLKEGKFKIDSEDEVTVVATTSNQNVTKVGHVFKNVSKDVEHTIIATVVPNSKDYSPLEYKFKVKILSDLPEPSGYVFGIDNKKRGNGYKATLDKDFTTLIFQSNQDIVKEVRIGKTDILGDSNKVEIKVFKNKYGKSFWQAIKDIELDTTEFEKWKIEVTPFDQIKYPKVTYTFELKGTEIPDSNLSFEMEKNEPRVYAVANRPSGMDSNDIDDYGVTSVDFTAYTMSKKAKMKGIRVHYITGDNMPGDIAIDFSSTATSRKHTGTLQAYDDKPTTMKIWTTNMDGSATDIVNGAYNVDINPVPLAWSYKKIANPAPGEKAYDEIVLSRKKIKNNRVYMIFSPWKEKFGFTVDLDAVSEKQAKFENIGALGQNQNMFRTSLNVTGMKSGDEKEIKCVLKHIKTGTKVMEYKVNIKMIE